MRSFILRNASRLYKSLWKLESGFFRSFPFLQYQPSMPVISVGNLTVGGTGKTPLLMALLEELVPTFRVTVLTRGYRSPWERSFYLLQGPGPHPAELTDETLLVHHRFPQVAILVGKNRFHSARRAERWLKPEFLLLDDGFQYRRLKQGIRLLLWDATDDPHLARLLPAGRLREPLERLREASAIILTRTELVSPELLSERSHWLNQIAPAVPQIRTRFQPQPLHLWNERQPARITEKTRLLPFAAIARPEHFLTNLCTLGHTLVEPRFFRDHHRFTAQDLDAIATAAKATGSEPVCTEKDLVKIPESWAQKNRLLVFSVRLQVEEGASSLVQALAQAGIPLQPTPAR